MQRSACRGRKDAARDCGLAHARNRLHRARTNANIAMAGTGAGIATRRGGVRIPGIAGRPRQDLLRRALAAYGAGAGDAGYRGRPLRYFADTIL